MGNYNTFRKRCEVAKNCQEKDDARFIVNGTGATIIHVIRTDEDQQAAIIIDKDEEGPDKIFVYTYKQEESIKNLSKGDYFIHSNDTYFIYEDSKIIRNVQYQKQRAYECNVCIQYEKMCYGAYFMSSLRKNIDDKIESHINLVNQNKPILIMPTMRWLKKDIVIQIGKRPWMIVDIDEDTNFGISYISLEPSFLQKHENRVYIQENGLTPGVEQIVDTNFGYFSTDIPVNIIQRSAQQIKFVIPYSGNITQINISTKDINNNIITKQYKVVL